MNAPLPWRDPVVAEIHAIRAALALEFDNDLTAYSRAAVALCQRLNLPIAPFRAHETVIAESPQP